MGIATLMATSAIAPAFAADDTASVGNSATSTTTPTTETKKLEVLHNGESKSKKEVSAGESVKDMKLIEDITLLKKVTIQSGNSNISEELNFDGMKGTLPNGTEFTLSVVKNGDKSALYMTTTEVKKSEAKRS